MSRAPARSWSPAPWHEQSRRNQAPFIAFNCAAIPEHLIESELFGHLQGGNGSQPGLLKQANGGTLFLR